MSTINELIKNKECLDTLQDGVRYELNDSIYVVQDDTKEGLNHLPMTIVQVFYAWLRLYNIKIDTDNIQEIK